MKLNKQEKQIVESVERGEWRSVRGVKKQIERYKEYAKAIVRKDKRVNIRMSEKDLIRIRKKGNGRRTALPDLDIQRSAQVRQ